MTDNPHRTAQLRAFKAKPITLWLPYDILYSIFLTSLQDEIAEVDLEEFSNRLTFPTIASQICRTWRQFALRMPSLWSHIWFKPSMVRRETFDQQILWIERSQHVGLQIGISFTTRNRFITQIMRLLRPHVERWRSFIVADPIKAKLVRTIFDELRGVSVPMLEVVRVKCDMHSEIGRWEFQAFGGGAPKLRELCISCGRYTAPPFARLTRLSIHPGRAGPELETKMGIKDMLRILSTVASTLETFKFDGQPGRSPHETKSLSSVTLPKLQRLDLKSPSRSTRRTGPAWFQELYSLIRAPSLPKINHLFRTTVLIELDKMGPFPFPGLRVLEITGDYYSDYILPYSTTVSILSQLPHLEELTLAPLHSFDMSVLVSCCPLLRKLVLNSGIQPQAQLMLKDVIEARRQKNSTGGINDALSHIRVLGFKIAPEEMKWLSESIPDFRYNTYQTWDWSG